jgi:hypothetical protein
MPDLLTLLTEYSMKNTLSTRLRSVIFQLACLVAAACLCLPQAQATVISSGQTLTATSSPNGINSYEIYGTLQYAVPQSASSSGINLFNVYSGGVLFNTGYLVAYKLSSSADSTIRNDSTGTINLILSFGGSSTFSNTSTFVNMGTVLAAHDLINTGTLKNEGTIFGGGNYTQTSGATINDGTIQRTQITFNGGTVSGHGSYIAGNGSTYVGDINAGSGAAINPTGALTFKANLISAGNFTFDLGSTSSDSLLVDGTATFTGGTVTINLLDMGNLLAGQSWTFLKGTSLTGLDTLSFNVLGLNPQLGYVIDTSNTSVSLRLTSTVPEPESLALLVAGLTVCSLRVQRQKELV